MTNFASILDESPDEVKAPPALPAGTYLAVVQGPVEYGKSDKKGTEYSGFAFRIVSAEDDVNSDDLAAIGGCEGKIVKRKYWHTEDSIFMLDQFHSDCGIDLKVPASRRARNEECINASVGVVIKHRSSDDGSRIFAEVARTLALD